MRKEPIVRGDAELQACDRYHAFNDMLERAGWTHRLLRITRRDGSIMLCMGHNMVEELQVRYGPTDLRNVITMIEDAHDG